MSLTEIFFGIVQPEYVYLITPISLIILGLIIKIKIEKSNEYVGRLSMFSNSMALTTFYISIPKIPIILALIINFSIVLGVIGLVSYLGNWELSTKNYYRYTRWFDSVIVGVLIGVYYLLPNLFI